MHGRTPDIGDVIGGRYRIVRLIGGGGMSTVYEAENTFTNKRVAVKWLLASLAGRPDARDRMLREARAGSRIKHRHVVDIYDVGFEGESMFLVMALHEGETLSSALESRSMSVASFFDLLLPVMRGVAEAHRLGVVHRDIKPDNILLAREVDHAEPVPMVLDFGIAKMEGDALRTRSGSAQGTPAFMAYEQIRGLRDLDARVDVYAFGVILYMALAGRMPFTAETWPELIYKLTSTEVVPLSTLRPELPPALCTLVDRAMARDREQRTATLLQLVLELSSFGGQALGETRQVVHRRELTGPQVPLSTTEPAAAAWSTPASGAACRLSHGSVQEPAAVSADTPPGSLETRAGVREPSEEALHTSTRDLPRGPRLRVLLPVAITAVGLLAVLGARWSPKRVAEHPRSHVVHDPHAARADVPRAAGPQVAAPAAATLADPLILAVNGALSGPLDAGALQPLAMKTTRPGAAPPRPPRARREQALWRPVEAREPRAQERSTAEPVPARRRMNREEFYGSGALTAP
jgi:tRNA A-37 threonylcarbamoyl transferase component Bud32